VLWQRVGPGIPDPFAFVHSVCRERPPGVDAPCPPGWQIAQRLDDLLELRDGVDQLAAAELPKGFGRD
jgi:hypothetical protein